MPYYKLDQLKDFLSKDEPFTREAIRTFFLQQGEQLTEENLKVRVNRLKSKGMIVNIGRGWYRLNEKKTFNPQISPDVKKLAGKINNEFPFLNYLVWTTEWLNQLITLQVLKNLNIIETESGSEESVFRMLKNFAPGKIYLNPTEVEWTKYIAENEDAVLVCSLISKSPSERKGKIKIPRLEKILVDLYCDKLWQMIFSAELDTIFREACMQYAINFSTLLAYASRRGKRSEIWNYIKSLNVLDAVTTQLIEK